MNAVPEVAGEPFVRGWFPRFAPTCSICHGPIYSTTDELVTILLPGRGAYAHLVCAEQAGHFEVTL